MSVLVAVVAPRFVAAVLAEAENRSDVAGCIVCLAADAKAASGSVAVD